MNFNTIPNVPQRLIFDRFTNTELVQLGHVCHHWEALQENQFRAREPLVLLVGGSALDAWTGSCFNEFRYYNQVVDLGAEVPMDTVSNSPQYLAKWFGLNVRALTTEFAQYLFHKFGNVTTLIIASTGEELGWTQDLPFLLSQWSQSLRTVKLFLQAGNRVTTEQINVNMILDTLNQMTTLTNLTIDFGEFDFSKSEHTFSLQILTQLNEFNIACCKMSRQMNDSITRYAASNARLTRIGLCAQEYKREDIRRYIELDTTSTVKFSHFVHSVRIDPSIPVYISTVSQNFVNLTHFWVNMQYTEDAKYKYHPTMTQLAALTNLTNLSIQVMFLCISKEDYEQMEAGQLAVPHLPSVQVLKLTDIHTNHHTLLTWANLGRIFPNVRFIELIYGSIQCRLCFPFEHQDKYARLSGVQHCLADTISSLKRCEHWKRLKITYPNEVIELAPKIMEMVRKIVIDDEEFRFELV